MKSSFYFVVWIVIYPILGLLGNPWINQNSFFVALIFVWALSWFINRSMPETISYERKLAQAQILNQVYSGNVAGFRKRLSRMSMIEFIGALYFGITFLITLFIIFKGGYSGVFELVIFGLLAAGTITRAAKLQKYSYRLHNNPTPQECVDVAQEMGYNYAAYYEERQNSIGETITPPAPRNFTAFQVFSLIVAIVCTVLGLVFIVLAILGIIRNPSFGATSIGIMYLLYGSLATYYGLRDCITSLSYFKH